jgi:YbgC/YbaW family acyl-CoA thioester hydrolase
MNLFFRLFWTILAARFRSPVSIMGPCSTPFRCLPTDLDVLKHMNNGVYLSLMDLARVDLMNRAGLAKKVKTKNWYPVVVAETIRFRKSLVLFDAFTIQTNIVGWDEKSFLLEQKFFRKGVCIADAVVRARLLKKSGGSVSPQEFFTAMQITPPSPETPQGVSDWNQNQL